MKPHMDDLVQSIGEIARASQRLARQAEKQYVLEVDDILQTRCRKQSENQFTESVNSSIFGGCELSNSPGQKNLSHNLCDKAMTEFSSSLSQNHLGDSSPRGWGGGS